MFFSNGTLLPASAYCARMNDSGGGNTAQAEYWEERSSSWIEVEDYTTLVTGSFGRRAMDCLAPEPGQRVLDVGCGTGPTTVELARRVAPGGSALGIDIAPSMLVAARARAGREGVENAKFVAGDAQSDDLGNGTFDAVFSQFGVMFFSDPASAFANLRRALRDGGRMAFACWQDIFSNEWMFVPGSAVVAVTGELPPMPDAGEPGPFSLADPAHIEQVLVGAGFASIEVVPHAEQVVVSGDRVEMVVDAVSRIGNVREALAANDDPVFHEQLLSAVRSALLERVHEGQLRLGAAALIVTAESAPR
jgi:ubiquinone/menaquinone biosynthesis C-methylase UbiE